MRAIEISAHGGPEVLDYVELAVPEVCGIVSGVGTGVTRLAVGDRVATSDAVGAYAEFAVAPATW